MHKGFTRIWTLGAVLVLGAAPAALAQSPEQFYKGKTVTITIGFSAGGTYDLFGRLVSRHIGKHIPGNPTVIAQSMPGAGSFVATNWLFNVAPKDGTAIGIVSQTIAMEEALKNKGVRYKSAEFNWIGRATSNNEVQVFWHTSKGTTIEGAKTAEIPVASTGPGSPSETYPKLLNALIGTRYKIIRGYTGSTAGLLAMERGEVDGALTSWNTMKTTRKAQLDEKKAFLAVQYVLKRAPDLPDVPAIVEFGKTDEDRALLTFAAASGDIGRAFLAPPGVPADRIKALRDAFDATMKDPELLAEVNKAQLDFEPASAAELERLVKVTLATPPALIEKMEKILAAE
jgi:tripartite-type tricarboxylate transporter receptor subunit TctC